MKRAVVAVLLLVLFVSCKLLNRALRRDFETRQTLNHCVLRVRRRFIFGSWARGPDWLLFDHSRTEYFPGSVPQWLNNNEHRVQRGCWTQTYRKSFGSLPGDRFAVQLPCWRHDHYQWADVYSERFDDHICDAKLFDRWERLSGCH